MRSGVRGGRERLQAVDAQSGQMLATARGLELRTLTGLLGDGNGEPLIALKGK